MRARIVDSRRQTIRALGVVCRILPALWSVACGDTDARPAQPGPGDGESIVSPQLSLVLGDWSGESGTDFQEIVGAFRDSQAGLLVVGNAGDGTIRFFQMDGEWLGSRGGIGDGPDEFERLGGVFEYRGDSVLAFDPWARRASVWPYEGRGVRWTSPADLPDGLRFPVLRGALRDGRLLWTAEEADDRYDEAGESHFRRVTVFLTSPQGREFLEVGETEGAALYRYRASRFARGLAPFSPQSFAVAADSVVYFGSTLLPRATRFTPSTMQLDSVRFGFPTRAVSPAQVEADLAIRRDEIEREYRRPTPLRDARMAELDLLPYPDSFPAIGAILAGRDGRLWVADYRMPQDGGTQRFPGSARWTAYSFGTDASQSYNFPVTFRLLWADEAVTVGIVQDSLGVEQIVTASVVGGERGSGR